MKFYRSFTLSNQYGIFRFYPFLPRCLSFGSFPLTCSSRLFSSKSSNSKSLSSDNYYDVLGVGKSSSRKEIRRAFLEKSKEYHPDAVSRSDLSNEQLKNKFQEINQAYQTLNDPIERQAYDENMRYRAGYSDGNKWRQNSYGNYSDYQQYRAHQEYMRQQGQYWASMNRQRSNQNHEEMDWKTFFRWKIGEPLTLGNLLLFTIVVGLIAEISHAVYIVRYISEAKKHRTQYGSDWWEHERQWNEVKDNEELLNRILYGDEDEISPKNTTSKPSSSPSPPPPPPPSSSSSSTTTPSKEA